VFICPFCALVPWLSVQVLLTAHPVIYVVPISESDQGQNMYDAHHRCHLRLRQRLTLPKLQKQEKALLGCLAAWQTLWTAILGTFKQLHTTRASQCSIQGQRNMTKTCVCFNPTRPLRELLQLRSSHKRTTHHHAAKITCFGQSTNCISTTAEFLSCGFVSMIRPARALWLSPTAPFSEQPLVVDHVLMA
jgi:hypothetical protein